MTKKIFFLFLILIGSLTQAQINTEWTINLIDSNYIASTIDDQENIYQVVTYYQPEIGYGISIQKYDKNGILKWSVPFEIENAFSYELIDIVIDNNKNVIAAIIASEYAVSHFYLTKFDSSGNQNWIRNYSYSIDWGFNYSSSIALDNNGNIFLSGTVTGSSTGYPFPNPTYAEFLNYLVVKYDSSGTEQWSRTYDGPSGLYDSPRDMVVDETGNVFITGISEKIDSIDYNNYWLYTSKGVSTIKYSSAGVLEWVDYLPNSDVSDIEIDGPGNVYVAGAASNGTVNYLINFMAAKFSSNGNRIWVKNFSKNQLGLYSNLSSVAIDNNGNVFVTGSEDHPTNYGYKNIQTIKYNSSGTEEWNNIVENVWINSSVSSENLKVLVSNSGNIFVHGYLRDEGAGYDGGIIKYDTDGNVLWELIENPTHTAFLQLANIGFVYVTTPNQLAKYRDEEASEEKYSPTNLSYDFDTHSLRWNKSLSNNVYYYQIFKQQYNPWTNTAGEWISVADSGGNVNKNDSIWVIQTSGFYNYKVGAVFQDTTLFCDSIFVQVGYVLRKRENGKVVAYNFSQDAFTQIRNRDNWPASWYNQFNYNNIFEYAPPILFNGIADSTYIDWHLFTNIIGGDKAYISQSIGLAGFIPVIVWKNAFAGNYRGSCAGFSMSSLFSFYKNPNYLQQFSYMVDKIPSQIPKTDDEARKVINHLQNTQLFSFPSKLEDEPSNLKSSNANYVLTRLMEIFSNYDNVQLDQYIALVKEDTAGHAVLPFAIRIADDRPNRYDIYVYDSNAPTDFFPLKIFTDKNKWSYIGLLIDSSASGISLNGPLSSRLGLLSWEDENSGGGGAGPQKINSTSSNNSFERTIYVSDSSSVNIRIGNEVVAGYDITTNSVINLDNSILEFADGIFRAPKAYVVQNTDSKVEFLNQLAGSIPRVMFQSDSKNYYVAERTDGALSNETESIDIFYEGLNYLNNDNSNKSINLITMSESYDEHKFARVSDLNVFQNDSIGFSFTGSDVNLNNSGNSKSYKLNLLSADFYGKKEFVNNSASISANSTHIIVPSWFNLEEEDLLILVDNNRDGSIDDSIYLPNQYEPLPVELSSFTAKRLHNYVRLDWQTSTEINNYGFEIERANLKNRENKVWTKIGFVEGNGNRNSTKNYSYQDKNITAGKYSYRLKQIDNDGQYEYSDEVEIDFGIPNKFELTQNYPNPFNPVTQINYSLPMASLVSIKIYNSVGELVKTLLEKDMTEGYHSVEWDATNNYGNNLSSGVYYYRIQAGDFVDAKKMILLK